MNAQPHSHAVKVRAGGEYWHIDYGDQNEMYDKPFRWLWDSDEAYNKRCVRRLRGLIVRVIRKHDIASRAADYAFLQIPDLIVDRWGSEQL